MKLKKLLGLFLIVFLWAGLALAGRYSDSSREYSERDDVVISKGSLSTWLSEQEKEREEEKKKNIIKYSTMGLLGAAYIGYRMKTADGNDS